MLLLHIHIHYTVNQDAFDRWKWIYNKMYLLKRKQLMPRSLYQSMPT